MFYTIEFTTLARKQLQKLQRKISDRIIEAIEKLQDNPRPQGCKKLKTRNAYRIRIGDYRVIYEIADKILLITVIAVGHRKDIYL